MTDQFEQIKSEFAEKVKHFAKLPKEFKENWIKYLRSGNYIQGTGRLYGNGRYCCLGVAAVSCGVDVTLQVIMGTIPIKNKYPQFEKVPKELKENDNLQRLLYHLNDKFKLTFNQIADIIEEYL